MYWTGHAPQPRGAQSGAVQNLLSTTASSVITMATLVLRVTTVAVQVAMGQFSPRIVRALLGDRWNQLSIALFALTFVHGLLVMLDVDDQANQVPGVSLAV